MVPNLGRSKCRRSECTIRQYPRNTCERWSQLPPYASREPWQITATRSAGSPGDRAAIDLGLRCRGLRGGGTLRRERLQLLRRHRETSALHRHGDGKRGLACTLALLPVAAQSACDNPPAPCEVYRVVTRTNRGEVRANWVIGKCAEQGPWGPSGVSRVSICPRRTVCKVRSSALHSLHLYHPESPVVRSMCISPHTCALHPPPSKIYILHRNIMRRGRRGGTRLWHLGFGAAPPV